MEKGGASQALAAKGWFISDMERVKAATTDSSSGNEPPESQLLNMDLRTFGARSLPDHTLLRKSSHLQGPIILQVASARDISRSSTDNALSAASHSGRLLRLKLTDGHTEITAIEYSAIPSIPNDIIPGTKVRLEGKCPVHNGIVCLNSKTISMLGGTVQTLYEEWQINRKYSGSARSASRSSQEVDASKPPSFERLQTGHGRSSYPLLSQSSTPTSRNTISAATSKASNQLKGDILDDLKISANTEKLQVKPNIHDRPKEVAEFNPVQNQAAAQKLLQKMNVQNPADRRPRGRMQRGKEVEDDHRKITLAEWEKKKAGTAPFSMGPCSSTVQDEDLARQLQEEFDLEDHVEQGQQDVAAENIKLSMFNFERDDHSNYETGSRGRGGRGRGRRGRGRGRGRG